MKRALFLVLALALLLSFTLSVSAGNDLEWQHESGAYIKVRQLKDDKVTFSYGWINNNTFDPFPTGYWIGVYNVTESHYHWGGGLIPVEAPPVPLNRSETVVLDPECLYKIVFFVYGTQFDSNLFGDSPSGGCDLILP